MQEHRCPMPFGVTAGTHSDRASPAKLPSVSGEPHSPPVGTLSTSTCLLSASCHTPGTCGTAQKGAAGVLGRAGLGRTTSALMTCQPSDPPPNRPVTAARSQRGGGHQSSPHVDLRGEGLSRSPMPGRQRQRSGPPTKRGGLSGVSPVLVVTVQRRGDTAASPGMDPPVKRP